MEEVARQLEPTHALLQSLKEWQLGFWSNGSGKPPGFFQTRIKSDDERYSRLADETKGQSTTLGEVHDFMVSQKSARVAREKGEFEKAERIKRNWFIGKWLLGVILSAAIAISGFLYHQIAPVIKIIWDDYQNRHPAVSEQIKNKAANEPDPALSSSQNSSLPQSFHH